MIITGRIKRVELKRFIKNEKVARVEASCQISSGKRTCQVCANAPEYWRTSDGLVLGGDLSSNLIPSNILRGKIIQTNRNFSA